MMKKGLMIYLFIMFVFAAHSVAQEVSTGWLTGQIMIKDGGPMSRGMVVFFDAASGPAPDPDRFVRIPDQITDLDEEGKFRILLPAGKYYMGAIKRMSGEPVGPPLDNDYFLIKRDKDGNAVAYNIEKDKEQSTGVVAEAEPFKRKMTEGASGISGIIVDMAGDPVERAIVFAYINDTMTGLPPFASYRTGPDGKYIITMDKGGIYYLRVRDVYGGGPPAEGSVMGGYGEDKPAPVSVKTGEITQDIKIKVVRHFERGPQSQKAAEQGPDKSIKQDMKQKMKEEIEKKK
ncbi:MAG: carboxypeptidase regulatory-like domain-containing protein [Nitrospiraceae bacterium]|nr:MAG: carboxypeptidase regulatory-like domain-containing protein [Nitrospiraceae bacterium]